jgi:hypothetical protein
VIHQSSIDRQLLLAPPIAFRRVLPATMWSAGGDDALRPGRERASTSDQFMMSKACWPGGLHADAVQHDCMMHGSAFLSRIYTRSSSCPNRWAPIVTSLSTALLSPVSAVSLSRSPPINPPGMCFRGGRDRCPACPRLSPIPSERT